MNEAMCRITGYSEEELLRLDPTDLLEDESRARFEDMMERWLRGEPPEETVECEVRRKDGACASVVLFGSVGRDEQGNPISATVVGHDITERKKMERALRESEERLRRAEEIAHLGSWELDVATGRLAWSEEVYRIFGLERHDFEGTYEAFLERVHPRDRQAVEAAYAASLQEGRDSYEIEHRVVQKKTGDVRWVEERCAHVRDSEGRVIRSVGMVLDITDRKKTEETLRQSEARFRALFEESPEAMFLTRPDGTILAANPAATQMFGWSEDELPLLGRAGIADSSDPRWAQGAEEREHTGKVRAREATAVRKSGEHFPVEVDSVILPSDPASAFVTMRDITERKRREINTALLGEVGKYLADLTDPDEIMNTVGARIGEALRLSGCQFVDVDEDHGQVVVHHAWTGWRSARPDTDL